MVFSKPILGPILGLAVACLVLGATGPVARAQNNPANWITHLLQPPATASGSGAG